MASVSPIPVGGVVVDSLPFSQGGGASEAQGFADAARVQACWDAGLGVFAVTFGTKDARQNPAGAIAAAKAWGLPAGTSIFLDVEGPGVYAEQPRDLIAEINTWGDAVAAAGYLPGVYFAPPQPLTSGEMYQLRVVRYWKGGGSIRDRSNSLAEPSGCGWCMTQMWPSQMCAGVLVDFNMVGHDFKGRAPSAAYP